MYECMIVRLIVYSAYNYSPFAFGLYDTNNSWIKSRTSHFPWSILYIYIIDFHMPDLFSFEREFKTWIETIEIYLQQ
jgi:hypothetical protein